MEATRCAIKQGWVEKRSNYIKQWRKRWLVLTPHTLSSFKSESPGEKQTEHIQLAAVLDVNPDLHSGRPNAFHIELKTQKFLISTASADLMTEWVLQIKAACAKLKPREETQEKEKAQTGEISEKLQSMLEVLTERENWLQSDLAQAQSALMAKAQAEVAYIQEVHDSIESVFSVFSTVYSSSEIPLQEKLSQLRDLASSTASLTPDTVCDSSLRAYANSDLIWTLLHKSIRVKVESPSERHLRRTEITRALKWRYNGQRYDALTFTVSRVIELTAVGFCTPHKANRITKVLSLKIVPGTTVSPNQNVIYVHPQMVELVFNPDESVQKIVLSQRVLLRPGTPYTLVGLLEGASTYKCVLCASTIGGEVNWTFATAVFPTIDHSNRTDADCGPIADFYYVFPCA